MPNYKCPRCQKITMQDHPISPTRGIACPRKSCSGRIEKSDLTYENPYTQVRFEQMVSRSKQQRQQAITNTRLAGRSTSAPPTGYCTNLSTQVLPHGVAYIDDVGSNVDWHPVGFKIRLAYNKLDPAVAGMQGLVIDPPNGMRHNDPKLQQHFAAVTDAMLKNHKLTDATEATGEAAAAWAVGQGINFQGFDCSGFVMKWGFDNHSGAGLDQIWVKRGGARKQYLVVEAKGPGAGLSDDQWQPPKVGTQMSAEWVIDRLARMSDPLGARILQQIGVTVGVVWPNYQGGSKSYYGETGRSLQAPTAELHGLVVTAKWKAGPALGCVVSDYARYY